MDDRLRKNNTAGRESRGLEDSQRKNEGLVSTDERLKRELLEKFTQEALPEAPHVPGYHTCWLSTTNQYDPIHKRVRMGYQPVLAEEVEGYEHLKVKSGENVGHISVNEMVLYKIPEEVYQLIMRQFHHDKPLEEQEMLLVQEEQMMGGLRDRKGRPLVQREGGAPFEAPKAVPVF